MDAAPKASPSPLSRAAPPFFLKRRAFSRGAFSFLARSVKWPLWSLLRKGEGSPAAPACPRSRAPSRFPPMSDFDDASTSEHPPQAAPAGPVDIDALLVDLNDSLTTDNESFFRGRLRQSLADVSEPETSVRFAKGLVRLLTEAALQDCAYALADLLAAVPQELSAPQLPVILLTAIDARSRNCALVSIDAMPADLREAIRMVALSVAAAHGDLEMTRFLWAQLDCASAPEPQDAGPHPDSASFERDPLFSAAVNDRPAVIEFLAGKCALRPAPDSWRKGDAFDHCVANRSHECADALSPVVSLDRLMAFAHKNPKLLEAGMLPRVAARLEREALRAATGLPANDACRILASEGLGKAEPDVFSAPRLPARRV